MSLFLQTVRHHRRQHLADLATHPFSDTETHTILRYGAPVGAEIEHHRQLDRCMNRLLHRMAEAEERKEVLAAGTIIVADRLTGSIGRFDRYWHAPEGGLWLAMAWPDILLPEFSRLLPFAVGLACCRTLRNFQTDARLQWVNNILVAGKKIGGILCETVHRPGGDRCHLLGIGLNVNNFHFPAELQDIATSLARELGREIERAEVLGRLLAELNWSIGLLQYDEEQALKERQGCSEGRSSLLLASWQGLSDTLNRWVEYGFDVRNRPLYRGTVSGLDPCGGLVIQLPDGSSITEYSGEIRYL